MFGVEHTAGTDAQDNPDFCTLGIRKRFEISVSKGRPGRAQGELAGAGIVFRPIAGSRSSFGLRNRKVATTG
jgi:hypothetical protein